MRPCSCHPIKADHCRHSPLILSSQAALSRKLALWASLPDSSSPGTARIPISSCGRFFQSRRQAHLPPGFNWVHQTVTDLDFAALGGPVNGAVTTNLTDFYNGGGPARLCSRLSPLRPRRPSGSTLSAAMSPTNGKATDRLTLSLNLRMESYRNPTCDTNCFLAPELDLHRRGRPDSGGYALQSVPDRRPTLRLSQHADGDLGTENRNCLASL